MRKYLTVLPVIYCQKGLYATCFQGSVIHLLYLFILLFRIIIFIIIFLKLYTFKTILWISIHSRGLKTYISARLTSIASKSKTRAMIARNVKKCRFNLFHFLDYQMNYYEVLINWNKDYGALLDYHIYYLSDWNGFYRR